MRIVLDARISRTWDAGVGRYTICLVEALSDHSEHECVLLISASATTPSLSRPAAVLIVRSGIPIASLQQHVLLPLAIRRLQPHVVLTTHPLAVPLFHPYPSVAVVLDLLPLHFPEQFPRSVHAYYRTIVAAVARRQDALIAISNATKIDVIQRFAVPACSIAVTPLAAAQHFRPVSDAPELSAMLRRYGIERPYILYHGNKRPHKNVVGLIRAFASVHRDLPHLSLVVTGRENPHERECDFGAIRQEIAGLKLEESVIFTGFVPDTDLPHLYSAAEVTAIPSLLEGFGLPALESMACGTPVIGSTAGSLPEVIGDGGLLVNPRNIEELAQALRRIVSDPETRALLAERALARARRFSWSETAKLTLELVTEVRASHHLKVGVQ